MADDPTERTLRLLALLQSRRTWPAAELAHRVSASERTLRRDLARLRRLGYAVSGRPGPGGHYTLEGGGRVPPLLFEDDEVVALVAALRMAEARLAGDATARALAKLVGVLTPARSATAAAVAETTEAMRRDPPDLDPRVLAALTRAGAEEREVRFGYTDQHGRTSTRHVDTVRCLHTRGEWYVVAYDRDRIDWRLFRLDRVVDVVPGRVTTRDRRGPADDLRAWLESDFGRAAPGSP